MNVIAKRHLGIKLSNKKNLLPPGLFLQGSYQINFCMLHFRDLSDNGYNLFDKGANGDLHNIIKTFKHILVIKIYITSHIKGLLI